MTDQEIKNLYWATAHQYSPMADHSAVIVAFARHCLKAAEAAKPKLTFPPIDLGMIPGPAPKHPFEPFPYTERN